MSIVVSLICLGPSFQKMTHHFLLHGSLPPTNLKKIWSPAFPLARSKIAQFNYTSAFACWPLIKIMLKLCTSFPKHSLQYPTLFTHLYRLCIGSQGFLLISPSVFTGNSPSQLLTLAHVHVSYLDEFGSLKHFVTHLRVTKVTVPFTCMVAYL